jgi:hypothetical protein
MGQFEGFAIVFLFRSDPLERSLPHPVIARKLRPLKKFPNLAVASGLAEEHEGGALAVNFVVEINVIAF